MATTCDYCHKPLSLMRRLRGEQFCSIEHLDLFTSQQAELALERLAAEERPPTAQRPVLKRLSRAAENREQSAEQPSLQQTATAEPPSIEATPALQPLAAALNDSAEEAARPEDEVQEISQAEADAAFSRLAEAFAEQSSESSTITAGPPQSTAPPIAPAVSPKPVPEYPLAAFVSGVEFSPRAPLGRGRLESFEPVESWGKSTYPSAMPKFRSQPAEFGEVRTWNSGKVAAKVPPPAPTREFLAGKEPSAYAGPRGNVIEPQTVSLLDAQPQLPALVSQVDAIKAEWSGSDVQRMMSLTAGFRFLASRANSGSMDLVLQPEEFQGTLRQPDYHWTPSAIFAVPELAGVLKGAQLLADAAAGEFLPVVEGFARPVQHPEHHWSPSAAFVIPEHAPLKPVSRLPLSGSLIAETAGLEFAMPEARTTQVDSAVPQVTWSIPVTETWRSCLPAPVATSVIWDVAVFDAEMKAPTDVALPAPPAWTFHEGFEAGRVSMPVWQSAPVLAPARPVLSWTGEEAESGPAGFAGAVAMPGLPGASLVVGRMGASFGWEQESARVGASPEACDFESAVVGDAKVHLDTLRARIAVAPSRTPLIVPEEHEALTGEGVEELKVDGAVAPAESRPRYDDFRARVRTGLTPGERRGFGEWVQPRLDHSMIVTEPIAASRPALAEVHADMEQPYRIAPARFEGFGAVETPIGVRAGDGPAAVPFSGATCEFALSGWAKLAGAKTAMPVRAVLAMRGTSDAKTFAATVETAGPARYSPVTLVVVPPPQFALLAERIGVEERFAAQAPVSLRTSPRVRATGYRMMGPFPKLPPCVPDSPFVLQTPDFAPAVKDVPRHALEQRQDLAGLPEFPISGGYHLHPADYWAWPTIKVPHSSRVAADVVAPESPISSPVRRFGPERAGLQTNLKSADGLPRRGA